jgi:NAD-dependent deacetylase
MVPLIADAAEWVGCCQVFIVVGTSLQVYPAAGLLHYVPEQSPIYIIDPNMPALREHPNLHAYEMSGSEGMKQVFEALTGVKP